MRTALFLAALVVTSCGQSPLDPDEVRLEVLDVVAPGAIFPQLSSVQLRAVGVTSDGRTIDLTREVTWGSSNDATVLVTNEGVAVLRGSGAAVVRATWGGTTGAQVLVSTPASAVKLVVLPVEGGPVARGSLVQLRALATFSDGTSRDVTGEALWGSLNGSLTLEKEPGQFRALLEGAAEARASFEGHSAEFAFEVEGAVLTSLDLQAPEQVLWVGDQQQLEVLARFSDGSEEKVGKHCRWSSSEEGVLQVSEDGLISAFKAGSATIVVKLDGQSASLDFQIGERAPANLTWNAVLPRLLEVPVARERPMVNIPVYVAPRGETGGVVVAEPVELSGIRVTLPGGRLVPGQRASFSLVAAYSDGSEQNVTAQATFVTGPEVKLLAGAAEVELLAEALGTATVTAEFEGQVVQFIVEVSAESIVGLGLVTLADGDKAPGATRLEAIARWSDGSQTVVTELCEWFSSDPAAGQVSNVPGERGQVVGSLPVTIGCKVGGAEAALPVKF